MNKQFLKISLCIGLLLTVFSCKQDNAYDDLRIEERHKQGDISLDLSANMVPLDVVDYDEISDDELRAGNAYGFIYCENKGYGQVPHLFIKKEEVAGGNTTLPIRLGIINVQNEKIFEYYRKYQNLPDDKDLNNRPEKASWYLEESNGKQRLHSYYKLTSEELKAGLELNGNTCYGFIALGGYKKKTKIKFKDDNPNNSPNLVVRAVKNGDIDARHIPMMTAIKRLEVRTGTATNSKVARLANANFKPRGSFVGIRLRNKLGKQATIKSIKVEDLASTPFHYRGEFDWAFMKGMSDAEKANLLQKDSFSAQFTGVADGKEQTVFPIVAPDANGNDAPYILGTAPLNDDSRTIYLWGYQREDRKGKSFAFKVTYVLDGETQERETKLISVNPPKSTGFFVDGTAYRVTISLIDKNTKPTPPSNYDAPQKSLASLNGENLLDPEINNRWELPELNGGSNYYYVTHKVAGQTAYSVEYNTDKRHSRWVAFQFNQATEKDPQVKRKNKFKWLSTIPKTFEVKPDWYRSTMTTNPKNGKYITYDRGHLCSSEDRVYNQTANDLTFDYINMSPQLPNFNRGYYGKKMEKTVQEWGQDRNFCDILYVVKGGTIRDDQIMPERLKDKMVIPKYYFMAMVAKKGSQYQGIAFWIEHKSYTKATQPALKAITCSIDELEKKTGINFFCNMPDPIEKQVEAENADSHTWPNLI